MSVVRLINQHLARPDGDIRHVWIEAGHTIELNKTSFMRLYVDRCGEQYIPKVEISRQYRNGLRSHCLELRDSCWLDLIHICGVMALPRAMEMNWNGGVRAVFMEFLKVDTKLRWAL